MFRYFKFILQFLTSAKYIKKGKCKQCGNCCRNIILYSGNTKITTKSQFEEMKEKNNYYKNFYISGKIEEEYLLFTCRELDTNNRCKVYFFRGLGCRLYPRTNSKFLINRGEPLDGCGYYFEPSKKFQSYFKN